MYVRYQEKLAELKTLERKERDATRSKRLRIVILAMEGWTALSSHAGIAGSVSKTAGGRTSA